MGKKAKEHRAKVTKRNAKTGQAKYAMQNALTKMMEKMAKEKGENEGLQVKIGNENLPFEVVAQPTSNSIKGFEFEGNVSFKEENPEILNFEEVDPKQDNEQ
jgi:peroxiredoxin family protein